MIATPVPTHYELGEAGARGGEALPAEKPPAAMRAAEMEELQSHSPRPAGKC